jgi:predicted O-methyltransferase YrrM
MAELETAGQLRIATSAALTHYFRKRADSLRFYRRVRHHGEPPPTSFRSELVLFHSWLPGFIEIDNATAGALRDWMREGGLPPVLPPALARTLAARGWCQSSATPQLDHLLEKAFAVFPAIQNPRELRRFLNEVAALTPRTVVEIGTAAGGVLYCLSQLAHRDALLVSIDVPGGHYGEGQDEEECKLFTTFVGPRQRLAFIRDRSFHYSTRQDLTALLDGRKIDLLFIDGDHSYAGVKSDFEMYGSLVAPGGMVAFHDIMMFPDTWGRGFDVGILWRELAQTHQTREIVDPHAPRLPPPLEEAERWGMPALGFGLVISP